MTGMPLARFATAGLVLLALALVGCSQDALLQKFASPEEQATAKKYVDDLRAGQYAQIEAVMDSRLKSPTLRATLQQMAAAMPDEEPSSVKLVGAESTMSPAGTIKNLTFEYRFSDRWVLINVATHRKGDEFALVGFNIYPQAQSLEELSRFRLSGKSPGQYLVLVLAILLPLFSLYALIACIRTRMTRRKWLWILFILCGVCKVSVNWTTGEWQVSLLTLQLLSASVLKADFGQWILGVSLPLGAILFLFRRRTAPA